MKLELKILGLEKLRNISKQCFLCSSLTVFEVFKKKATSRLLAKSQQVRKYPGVTVDKQQDESVI